METETVKITYKQMEDSLRTYLGKNLVDKDNMKLQISRHTQTDQMTFIKVLIKDKNRGGLDIHNLKLFLHLDARINDKVYLYWIYPRTRGYIELSIVWETP